MIFTRKFLKLSGIVIVFLVVFNLVYIYSVRLKIDEVFSRSLRSRIRGEELSGIDQKVSWEDLEFIYYERTRIGPGEHGDKVVLTDPIEIKKNEEWLRKEGFYVGVSNNNLSITRALPERRPEV